MNKLVKYIIEQKFNFNIDQLDLKDNEGEFSLSKQQYKSKSMKQEYIDNNLFVDLGLPSGTKWCKYNLGCDFGLLFSNPESTSPKDWYGKYYAWGETKEKDYYDWDSYRYASNNSPTELLPEDDAAYQCNSNWRMPTRKQCQELINHTDSEWISGKRNNLYMNIKGLAGRIFTSRVNGNQMFIPAAGYKHKSSLCGDGFYCILWSSNLKTNDPSYASSIYFNSDFINVGIEKYYDGFNVRPVLNKNN